MSSRSLRSAVFMFSLMVFSFLFIAGSSRLIGCTYEIENRMPERTLVQIDTSLTAVPVLRHDGVVETVIRPSFGRHEVIAMCVRSEPEMMVLSDANGNVLGHRSYIHEVYQAFVLNDGFV